MTPEICLGTAQFGLNYGITNIRGQISEKEIELILLKCHDFGINFIDTAQAYGVSEMVIGRNMPKDNKFEIINKLPDQNIINSEFNPKNWEIDFQKSLKKLNKKSINSFLLHNPSNLLGKNKDILLNWLISLRERKLIKRIGVSIYESRDLVNLPLEEIQIVQLPFSLYDQRLLKDGTIKNLYKSGIAVHARSIFLQGLILQKDKSWPNFISNDFKIHHSKTINNFSSKNISMLEAAMGFAQNCYFIESFLVGVTSLLEFDRIISTWKNLQSRRSFDLNYSSFSWNNNKDLDPRLWKKK